MFSIYVYFAFMTGVFTIPILFVTGCIVKDFAKKSLFKETDCPECHATISKNELCPFCTEELILPAQED